MSNLNLEKMVNNTAIVLLLLLVGVFSVSIYRGSQLKKAEHKAASMASEEKMRTMTLRIESIRRDMQEIKRGLSPRSAKPHEAASDTER
jgi:hypothetical protein